MKQLLLAATMLTGLASAPAFAQASAPIWSNPTPAVVAVDLPPSTVREAATVAAAATLPSDEPTPAEPVAPVAPAQTLQAAPSYSAQAPRYAPPAPTYSSPAYSAPALSAPAYANSDARVPATAARYRQLFGAIRAGDWANASYLLDATATGPLHAVARAEIYLAKDSPRVDAGSLLTLIEGAPDLPQAAQLAALARGRGVEALPLLPIEGRLLPLSTSPRRERVRPTAGDPSSDSLRTLAEPLIKGDQPAALESLLREREAYLSPDARSEWQQQTAWAYYVIGNYDGARRMAEAARLGSGPWSVPGDWVLGLTAWRQNDCAAASDAFSRVAGRAADSEMIAAGHFWAARADLMCKRPERVQARMRSAARLSETFYGLLAEASLNVRPRAPFADVPLSPVIAARPNVRAAMMLAEIGETRLADQLIRHQARLTGRTDHRQLLHLAARLNLPSTQFWLAHNGVAGAVVHPEDRYPAPRFSPTRGWRVDPSLVFAHTLQESNFRTAVISPAGATGLMQVRPGTAGDIARARGEYFSRDQLTDPAYNIEFGQTYLEQLRDRGATGGLLPKVIAAYNAGPVPVERWNLSVRDGGDPLLWIESLPYWETRGYVPTILRNYWVYQRQAGQPSPSLTALSQGKWPLFPTVGQRVAGRAEAGQILLRN